ncbi:MAG: hypothetical protein NZ899_10285 [Thermoguttaceae bacterium]|nr:hypothetical protein [Thermoguttaceae bacterium]MDW8078207.1 hypothetical protein [Thermoguttaceae bacterium]
MNRRKRNKRCGGPVPAAADRLMEIFQPAKDSLSDPALSSLAEALKSDTEAKARFEAVLAADERIRRLMHAVPTPPGLAEGVLSALAARFGISSVSHEAEAASSEVGGGSAEAVPAVVTPTPGAALPGFWGQSQSSEAGPDQNLDLSNSYSRFANRVRGVFRGKHLERGVAVWVSVSIGLTALLFCAIWPVLWLFRPGYSESQSVEQVLQLAIATFQGEEAIFASGTPVSAEDPPWGYRPSKFVGGVAQSRWRWVRMVGGTEAVAFDLPRIGSGRATLYVFASDVSGAPAIPPEAPMLNTATFSASLWRENGVVMALVVAGGPVAYRQYLSTANTPIA